MKGFILLLLLMIAPTAMSQDDVVAAAAGEVVEAVGATRLVVLGEMHGTREIPLLVAELAEHYSGVGPLVLALEMERTEHEAITGYLASDGAAASRNALRLRPYWNIADRDNDGRRSVDMLELIESIRKLRAEGRDVAIVPYDLAPHDYGTKPDRERSMASNVERAYKSLPRGRMLVLTGNVHALLQPRTFSDIGRTIEPMTYHLRDLQPYSIKVSATAGEIWGCRASHACGTIPYVESGKSGPWRAAPAHHHYQLVLPAFSVARLAASCRPDATELDQDPADRRMVPIKQSGDLVQRLSPLPPVPHQALLTVRVPNPRPSLHPQHSRCPGS